LEANGGQEDEARQERPESGSAGIEQRGKSSAVHSVPHAGLNPRDDQGKYDSRDEGDREHQGKGKQGDLRPGTDVENIWTRLSYLGRKEFVAEEC